MNEEEILVYALKGWIPYICISNGTQFLRNVNDTRYFWLRNGIPVIGNDWIEVDLRNYKKISWKDFDNFFLEKFKEKVKITNE